MDNDEPDDKDPFKNGKTLNYKNPSRFDGNRKIQEISDEDGDENDDDIDKVKQKNRDLKFIVGKMRKQLDDLTKEMQRMNNFIVELQKEKKQLFDLLQKKSPKKSPKRKKAKNGNNSTEQKSTQKPAPTDSMETNIHAESNDLYATEGDGNSPQKSATQSQNSSSEDEDDESDRESEKGEKDENPAHNSNNKVKRSLKIPPIDVWSDNRAEIQREIQNNVPSDSCLYSRINNGKFRIFANDANTRAAVINYLNLMNLNYNTYTPSDSKMINVLIKGLDHIDDPNAIKSELAAKGFEPHLVKKHVTGYMRKNNSKSNLWLVVLQPNTDTNELFQIKSIDHAIVKFEFLRKPKVIQCRRCQRFHHSASNCNLPYRCVKCTDSHEPGKCSSTTKKNKFKPKCVNCNGNHTANDAANCEVFKKVIASKEDKKKPPIKVNMKSSMRSTETYAAKLKGSVNKKPATQNNGIYLDKFMSEQNKMLMDFMSTMQKMQQHFIASLSNRNG